MPSGRDPWINLPNPELIDLGRGLTWLGPRLRQILASWCSLRDPSEAIRLMTRKLYDVANRGTSQR